MNSTSADLLSRFTHRTQVYRDTNLTEHTLLPHILHLLTNEYSANRHDDSYCGIRLPCLAPKFTKAVQNPTAWNDSLTFHHVSPIHPPTRWRHIVYYPNYL